MGKTPFHTPHSGVSLATSRSVSLSNGTSLKMCVIAHPRHLGQWFTVGDLEPKQGVGAVPSILTSPTSTAPATFLVSVIHSLSFFAFPYLIFN